jgi:ABC-type transport system involved in cytochrome bd biosynthesis fused ATPase/permease subunit
MKLPLTSLVLAGVSILALVLAVLQWLNPAAALVIFVLSVLANVGLPWVQKAVGNREQKKQVQQERLRTDAVAESNAILSSELRTLSNVLSRTPETMQAKESQVRSSGTTPDNTPHD